MDDSPAPLRRRLDGGAEACLASATSRRRHCCRRRGTTDRTTCPPMAGAGTNSNDQTHTKPKRGRADTTVRRDATPRHAKRGRRRAGPDPDPDPSCHPVTHRLLAPTGHHHRTRPLARGAPLQPQLPVKFASHLALLSPPLSPLCPLSQFPGPDLGS